MIARRQAIKTLEDYWGTKKFVFQSDFHIPKNIERIECKNTFYINRCQLLWIKSKNL